MIIKAPLLIQLFFTGLKLCYETVCFTPKISQCNDGIFQKLAYLWQYYISRYFISVTGIELISRIFSFSSRYQALVDHSLDIGGLLDNSRKGLRHLVLTYQELSAWMDGMEQYLAKRKILPVHMEKLLRQMDELAVSVLRNKLFVT